MVRANNEEGRLCGSGPRASRPRDRGEEPRQHRNRAQVGFGSRLHRCRISFMVLSNFCNSMLNGATMLDRNLCFRDIVSSNGILSNNYLFQNCFEYSQSLLRLALAVSFVVSDMLDIFPIEPEPACSQTVEIHPQWSLQIVRKSTARVFPPERYDPSNCGVTAEIVISLLRIIRPVRTAWMI